MSDEERPGLRGCGTPIIALTYPLALIGLPLLACCVAWPLSHVRRSHAQTLTQKVTDGVSAALLCIVFLFFLMLAADPSLFYVDDWDGECEDDTGRWEYGRPPDCRPVTAPLCKGQVSKEAKAGAAIAGIVVGTVTYLCVYLGCNSFRPLLPPHEDIVYVRHLDEVTCPKGYASGAKIVFELPAGQRVRTLVPRGVEAGMMFKVDVKDVESQEQRDADLTLMRLGDEATVVQLALPPPDSRQQQPTPEQAREKDALYPAMAAALKDDPLPEGQPSPEAIGAASD